MGFVVYVRRWVDVILILVVVVVSRRQQFGFDIGQVYGMISRCRNAPGAEQFWAGVGVRCPLRIVG